LTRRLKRVRAGAIDQLRRRRLHVDVQRLVDDLVSRGLNPSTVRNALLPLRAICRRALRQGDINANPTAGVEIPAVRGRRTRIVTPAEALQLVQSAPQIDRALWATAFYAGLRRGELQALTWGDVDLARGVISVERSWDQKQGLVDPKSAAGRRRVPIAAVLRDYLLGHRLERQDGHRAFGRADGSPFNASTIAPCADRAWGEHGLRPETLHECRHTFATLMIAAGVNAKALQTFVGHSSITVTLDRYGHLFPGSEQEAADPSRCLPRRRGRACPRGRDRGLWENCGKDHPRKKRFRAPLSGS
jgi:integrase